MVLLIFIIHFVPGCQLFIDEFIPRHEVIYLSSRNFLQSPKSDFGDAMKVYNCITKGLRYTVICFLSRVSI